MSFGAVFILLGTRCGEGPWSVQHRGSGGVTAPGAGTCPWAQVPDGRCCRCSRADAGRVCRCATCSRTERARDSVTWGAWPGAGWG